MLLIAGCNQRLIAFELLEEIMNRLIDNWNNVYYPSHNVILNKDIAFSFDNFYVNIIILLIIIYHWVLGMELMCNLWYGVFNPQIFRINQRSYALNIRFKLVNVLWVEFAKARLYWMDILLVFWTSQKGGLFWIIQISKRLINTFYAFLFCKILTLLFFIFI